MTLDNKPINFDINRNNLFNLTAKQFDTTGARSFTFRLLKNSIPFDLTGLSVKVGGKKPDGKDIFNSCTIKDTKKGIVELELTTQMQVVAGMLNLELIIFKGETRLSTIPFEIQVVKSVTDFKEVENSNEFRALQEALWKTDNVYDKSEIDNFKWSMSNMGQDVKEAMTGGSVAVVGKDAVGSINLQNGSVTSEKTNFISLSKNLFNKKDENIELNKKIDDDKNEIVDSSGSAVSGYIAIENNKDYSYTFDNDFYGLFATFILYDINKKPLKAGFVRGNENVANITIDDEKARYIRVTLSTRSIDDFMFNEGNIIKPYDDFDIMRLDDRTVLTEAQKNETKKISNTILNKYVDTNNNLFNKDEVELNCYLNSDGKVTNETSERYGISGYIAIESNKDYILPYFYDVYGTNAKVICFYDKEKKFLFSIEGATDKTNKFIIFNVLGSKRIKYCRFNIDRQEENNIMMVQGNVYPSVYKEYNPDNKALLSNDINLNSQHKMEILHLVGANSLNEKIITFNGDSVCYGEGYIGGYGKIIAEKNNMIYENISVSGATLSNKTEGRHHVCDSINKMRDDADYIILEGGINDTSLSVPKGEITDNFYGNYDKTTFCGALESIFYQSVLKWKGKKIGFIIIHKAYSVSNQVVQNEYWELARNICRKWSIPFLDLFNSSGLICNIPEINDTFFKHGLSGQGDQVHPNERGYKEYLVPKIEAWIKTL
ncbi:BppU family phage baseplate upper protein [Clostridium perfringens]|nr:BppU family phage baseplate upper protein [Clostridium perfringens]